MKDGEREGKNVVVLSGTAHKTRNWASFYFGNTTREGGKIKWCTVEGDIVGVEVGEWARPGPGHA